MLMYEKLIRDALKDQTIRELSLKLNLPTQTINDWTVLNKRPRVASLIKVAAWANLPLWAMLIDTEGNPADKLAEQIITLSDTQQHQLYQQVLNHAHQQQ